MKAPILLAIGVLSAVSGAILALLDRSFTAAVIAGVVWAVLGNLLEHVIAAKRRSAALCSDVEGGR